MLKLIYLFKNDNFVWSHCKTNVIICNYKNNVQTKDLKFEELQKYNIKDNDPLGDIDSICFILNPLYYNP